MGLALNQNSVNRELGWAGLDWTGDRVFVYSLGARKVMQASKRVSAEDLIYCVCGGRVCVLYTRAVCAVFAWMFWWTCLRVYVSTCLRFHALID